MIVLCCLCPRHVASRVLLTSEDFLITSHIWWGHHAAYSAWLQHCCS